ncbi:hypothetical protein [Candidatus Vondammii sp. HM_W22]|uniref:hypothetical protein n=1 Tax=Candidatus Vondammii sp. HM_W22 TaxID=2687299 RepID=UPI00403DB1AB
MADPDDVADNRQVFTGCFQGEVERLVGRVVAGDLHAVGEALEALDQGNPERGFRGGFQWRSFKQVFEESYHANADKIV